MMLDSGSLLGYCNMIFGFSIFPTALFSLSFYLALHVFYDDFLFFWIHDNFDFLILFEQIL